VKIAITDKVHKLLVDGLEQLGHEVIYDTKIDNVLLATMLSKLDGVIINSKIKMNADMIDLGQKLKFIGRLGSGMEIIDVSYAESKGITCINTPDGNCDAVAEHAIGMLLCLANNLITANEETKKGIWNRETHRGFEIMGKTIGIIGVGHTGGALAQKLKGFGLTILGNDKFKNQLSPNLDHVQLVDLETICKKSDIISFHLPLTEDTKHLGNQDFFNKCRPGVIIINTSRGEVIKTKDLNSFLKTGKIAAACLDVFENEKVSTFTEEEKQDYFELAANKNVLMTPHVAGWTHQSLERIALLMLNRILETIT
jgi:D-3-phosphoglycerate dehydrogenase / 2-oxoglutarate reductase